MHPCSLLRRQMWNGHCCEETPVYFVDRIMIIRQLRSNVVYLFLSLCCIERIRPLQRNTHTHLFVGECVNREYKANGFFFSRQWWTHWPSKSCGWMQLFLYLNIFIYLFIYIWLMWCSIPHLWRCTAAAGVGVVYVSVCKINVKV